MKTYSQTKKMNKFNWYDFLSRAIEGKAKESEIVDAQDNSFSWVTCAVGNQCAIIPRDAEGGPLDGTLYDLGVIFNSVVEDSNWKKALQILNRIEKLSAILIQKELDKMIKTIKAQGYKVTKV